MDIRPKMLPAQRIILSNVSSIISNSQIENLFRANDVKLCFKITYLKVGISNPEFSHIFNFRRQIYIHMHL